MIDAIIRTLFALALTMLVVFLGLTTILFGHEVNSILSGEVNECIRTK